MIYSQGLIHLDESYFLLCNICNLELNLNLPRLKIILNCGHEHETENMDEIREICNLFHEHILNE